jgi:hypothetical protein
MNSYRVIKCLPRLELGLKSSALWQRAIFCSIAQVKSFVLVAGIIFGFASFVFAVDTVTLSEAVGQAGWMGQGETVRILGTARVVSDNAAGVTVSSVAVQASGYTADGNLTNVEVWVSSSGYIDANAIRLENTAKAFSSNAAVFTQDVLVSTTPLYFIVRSDASGSATEGTFELALEAYTSADTVNNPIAFSNATDVVAPPSGAPSGLGATAASNLLQINLSWGAAAGADSYVIYRASHSGVSTTDFLLTVTPNTSFSDDWVPPNQLMYYSVLGVNRAGASSLSGVASDTSVDVPALTTSNTYLRAGSPSGFDFGSVSFKSGLLSSPRGVFIDKEGNIYISNTNVHYVNFVPKMNGTYFGQSMSANSIYVIAGNGITTYNGDDGASTSKGINSPRDVTVDDNGNVYITDTGNHRIRFIPIANGTYFGQTMTANSIYTIAGTGTAGYNSDNVSATAGQINSPFGIAVDVLGNVIFADNSNQRVRFIPVTTGTYYGQSMTAHYIYTIAGTGTASFTGDGGVATSATFNGPSGVSVDAAGNVYISDYTNNRIRMVAKTSGTYFGQAMTAHFIYTIAGSGGSLGDGGAATSALVSRPRGVAVDRDGNVVIGTVNGSRARYVPRVAGTYFGQAMTANSIYTIAGTGSVGSTGDGGLGTAAKVDNMEGVSFDSRGNVYLADSYNARIRMVPKISGTNFSQPMTVGYIYTICGDGFMVPIVNGGPATNSALDNPQGVIVDPSQNIYYSEKNNDRVGIVPKTSGTYFGQSMIGNHYYPIAGTGVPGYSGDGGAATAAKIRDPAGVSLDLSGNVYISDNYNNRIRFIPKTGGTYFGVAMTANYIYTIAGNGTGSYGGDGGAATAAQIKTPYGLTVDGSGNVYIADYGNHRIRFIPVADGTYFGIGMTANYIYTIAGTGSAGSSGDGGLATSALMNLPTGVSLDGEGNVYIAAVNNYSVRFIPKTSGTYFGVSMTANCIYKIVGTDSFGFGGDAGLATLGSLDFPYGVTVDAGGNIFIADSNNNRIRFVPKTDGTYFGQSMTGNYIYTLGGTGSNYYDGENAAATGKRFDNPQAVFVGSNHMVYVADSSNDKIRMIAGEDFIVPSTSTLSAVTGAADGEADLSWNSVGDDGMTGDLTGNYRVQYATYTASWSASSTPADATTVTIGTTSVVPGTAQAKTISGINTGTYYFVLWSQDEANNWSGISNTTSAFVTGPTVTLSEAVGQAGWMGRGETQRILGTAQVVCDYESGVTISSVAVQASGYTADGNLTNVEVWVSSSGYIDANAFRLEDTAKAFSSNAVVFTQDVVVSTTPLYFIARSDVSGSATEGTFEMALQVYATALKVNNPIAFSNATDVVAPPSGAPSGLTATAASNLLQVNLSWSGATGVDSYTIYRATYSGVSTTDFLLGKTNSTSFNDDYLPPNQQMYYTVVGTNRGGSSGASSASNATSVDLSALTTSNIYLRAGQPGGFGYGIPPTQDRGSEINTMETDQFGNLFFGTTSYGALYFVARTNGTYFGQLMEANIPYKLAGNTEENYSGDGGPANSAGVSVDGLALDLEGNVYIRAGNRIRFIPRASGTYFGQSMTANYIYTIAGTGTTSYGGDGGPATSAQLRSQGGISVDSQGNVFISDKNNHRIRFIPRADGSYFGQSMTAHYIYTVAGDGTGAYGGDGGLATLAQINSPNTVDVDVAGNFYVADSSNYRIRFVSKTSGTFFGQSMTANTIYTIAGNGTAGYLADNVAASSTRVRPYFIRLDDEGNILLAEENSYRVRFISRRNGTFFGQSMTANYIYTIAGTGTTGRSADGGSATSAVLTAPLFVCAEPTGMVYFYDSGNRRIRYVPRTNGTFYGQPGTAGFIYTLLSGEPSGYTGEGEPATTSPLTDPSGVSVDGDGNIFIADYGNHRIRLIPKADGTFFGQTMKANSLYTIAGTGETGTAGDGGLAVSAQVRFPAAVRLDRSGNVYISNADAHRIRFIPRTGGTYFGQAMTANYIYRIAGDGTGSYGGNGAIATSAQIKNPEDLFLDPQGNVFIADTGNHRVRFIPKANGTYFGQGMTADYIYTIVGSGSGTSSGDGGAAASAGVPSPSAVFVDNGGNLYVGEYYKIRFVPALDGTYFGQSMTAGNIYTIVGSGSSGYGGDGGAATSAALEGVEALSVDMGGNVYIGIGSWYNKIRFVPRTDGTYFGQAMVANNIYLIGGNGSVGYDGENSVATGKKIFKPQDHFFGLDHMLYLVDSGNNKIRMIAGEDFIAPSTSTLVAVEGSVDGGVDLSWASAGDDWMHGNLTGDYRIQYATTAATAWSTSSTPTGAYTLTISTTNVTPGVSQSTSVVVGLIQPWYVVIWTKDEVDNWSVISDTVSVVPFLAMRSVVITSGGGQDWGAVMMGSTVAGSTGTVLLNDGNVANTYSLTASTVTAGSPWSVQSSPPEGPNQLVIYGAFHGTAPVAGDYGVEDVVYGTGQSSTGTKFSVDGSSTGASVPSSENRTLWIRMDFPTTTTTVVQQTIKVQVTAQAP